MKWRYTVDAPFTNLELPELGTQADKTNGRDRFLVMWRDTREVTIDARLGANFGSNSKTFDGLVALQVADPIAADETTTE